MKTDGHDAGRHCQAQVFWRLRRFKDVKDFLSYFPKKQNANQKPGTAVHEVWKPDKWERAQDAAMQEVD